MPVVDQALLDECLAAAEADLNQLGWTTPDYLFGLAQRANGPGLELWSEMPGGGAAFLTALADLHVMAAAEVEGLVIVSTGGFHNPDDLLGLPAMGQLRCSCERAGVDPDGLSGLVPSVSAQGWRVRQRQVGLFPPLPMRGVMCVQRSGLTRVLVREDNGRPRSREALPRELGDHDALRELALTVLGERL